MENDEEDDAPALVNTSEVNASVDISGPASQLQDTSLVKVPLTIVTEFGDSADIEKALTVTQNGQEVQEWLELGNGCICCSIKDSGINAIESLMDRSGTFDYILLETSGLADPGNLAPIFWVDTGLGSSIYLDGIVTLVDAKNILLSLDENVYLGQGGGDDDGDNDHEGNHATTAHLQISHADVIVLNKTDTITSLELAAVKARIQAINGLAKIHTTQYGQVPNLESFLLDQHAYDGVDSLDTAAKGQHSHLDSTISTLTLPLPPLSPTQLSALESWLRSLLWDSILPPPPSSTPAQTFSIHRTKGLVLPTPRTGGGPAKMIQGVREVFEIVDLEEPTSNNRGKNEESDSAEPAQGKATREGKLVFIGRGLSGLSLAESLMACLGEFERE